MLPPVPIMRVFTRIHTYMYATYIHAYMNAFIYIYIHTHTAFWNFRSWECSRAYTHACTLHTCTHTRTPIYIPIHIHIYTHSAFWNASAGRNHVWVFSSDVRDSPIKCVFISIYACMCVWTYVWSSAPMHIASTFLYISIRIYGRHACIPRNKTKSSSREKTGRPYWHVYVCE
jgi:hypothetical protein